MGGRTEDFLDGGDRPPWGGDKGPMGGSPPPYLITLGTKLVFRACCTSAGCGQLFICMCMRTAAYIY